MGNTEGKEDAGRGAKAGAGDARQVYANLVNSSEGRRPPTVDDRVFRVFCYILKAAEVKRRYEEAPPEPLTPQEQRVYYLISTGHSVEAIANRLSIKNRSVQNLIESIRGKRWIR